ncbi:hypothetical protein OL229_05845 [Neisseriaceae bacterium JH1-16]|nr:hypothetical protein [Neisseriaceae bacterium JH1-16]
MTLDQFEATLCDAAPPAGLSEPLTSLWLAANDRWEEAHELVRHELGGYAWVHAYLHRVEGVIWNADYWYGQAGKRRPSCSLQEEWRTIAAALLAA